MAFHSDRIAVTTVIVYFIVHTFVYALKRETVIVGNYFSITCDYNKPLGGKVFYIFLSWDPDNAVAYIFRNELVRNRGTRVYQRVRDEGFDVVWTPGESKLLLTIGQIRMSHQNLTAVCLVKDDDGRGAVLWKRAFLFDVINPPKIFRFRKSVINVTRGSSRHVELVCTAAGFPTPTVRWWKRSPRELLQPQSFDPSSVTARHVLATPYRTTQDGHYLCEATTAHPFMQALRLNRAYSAIFLNVQHAPKFARKERTLYTDFGQMVKLEISVAANPQPELHCSMMKVTGPKYSRFRGKLFPHNFQFSVDLPRVERHHIIDYPCLARNEIGEDTSLIRIRLGPSTPMITSPPVSEYADYFPLWWTAMSGSRLKNVTLQISRRRANGDFKLIRTQVTPLAIYTWRRSTANNQTFLSHVTNLSSNTAYAIRLRTCNRNNCSRFSPFHLFRTAPYNGTNGVNPQIFLRQRQQQPTTVFTTTMQPKNIRMMKRCEPAGYNAYSAYTCGASMVHLALPLHCVSLRLMATLFQFH